MIDMTDPSSMCTFVMMRINAFLDDELDEQTADEVREHISNCAQCLEEIDIWMSIRSAMKRAYSPGKAPPMLIERVSVRIKRLQQND